MGLERGADAIDSCHVNLLVASSGPGVHAAPGRL